MNEILIYEFIGSNFFEEGVTAKGVLNQLKDMSGDVTVRVNSPGGDVFDGFAIFNILDQYDRGDINVVVDGLAASAASVIAMAGKTTMAENALLMVHNPWTFSMGEAKDMRKTAETLETVKNSIITTYQTKSSLDADAISELMDSETWFDANGAKVNGFVDEIEGESTSIAACSVPWIRNQPEEKTQDGNVVLSVNAISSEISVNRNPADRPRRIELLQRLANLA